MMSLCIAMAGRCIGKVYHVVAVLEEILAHFCIGEV